MTNTLLKTLFIIDCNGIAHTTVSCEEYHAPALGRMMGGKLRTNGMLVCADCEPDD